MQRLACQLRGCKLMGVFSCTHHLTKCVYSCLCGYANARCDNSRWCFQLLAADSWRRAQAGPAWPLLRLRQVPTDILGRQRLERGGSPSNSVCQPCIAMQRSFKWGVATAQLRAQGAVE